MKRSTKYLTALNVVSLLLVAPGQNIFGLFKYCFLFVLDKSPPVDEQAA
jgi:hypothetical protein